MVLSTSVEGDGGGSVVEVGDFVGYSVDGQGRELESSKMKVEERERFETVLAAMAGGPC